MRRPWLRPGNAGQAGWGVCPAAGRRRGRGAETGSHPGEPLPVGGGGEPATVGIDLHAKTGIRICSGDAQQWRNQPKREWDKYTFGCYGCWVMDDDGNLDYVSEEDYTEELWNEQKKSGERNRATALHK